MTCRLFVKGQEVDIVSFNFAPGDMLRICMLDQVETAFNFGYYPWHC